MRAQFINERTVNAWRAFRQSTKIISKLSVIRINPDPVADRYMKLKQRYGGDILLDVVVHTIDQSGAIERIKELNADSSIHGIIVQIPLPDPTQTNEILDTVIKVIDLIELYEKCG